MHLSRKYIPLLLTIIIIFISFTGCTSPKFNLDSKSTNNINSNLMIVHYLDVGQADSILLQVNNKNILIDAGNRDDGNNVVDYLSSHGVSKLDYVIATHPHEDHIGGMSTVIKKIPIGQFFAPKVTANTKTFQDMIKELQDKKLKITAARAGISFDLGNGASCDFLAPNSNKYDDLNNYSAVVKIAYKNTKFLFMGDAEKLSEKEILDKGYDLSCDVLKIGHHGSSSSSSAEFLDKASPEIAVISCGKGNDYGHPHKQTLDALKKRKIQIYRTDLEGTIVITSDGNKLTKKQQ